MEASRKWRSKGRAEGFTVQNLHTVLAGESPARSKVNHQAGTESCSYPGNWIVDA